MWARQIPATGATSFEVGFGAAVAHPRVARRLATLGWRAKSLRDFHEERVVRRGGVLGLLACCSSQAQASGSTWSIGNVSRAATHSREADGISRASATAP